MILLPSAAACFHLPPAFICRLHPTRAFPAMKYRTTGVSVYARRGRQVYYISFRDPLRPDKYRIHEATPFRRDDPEGMRKANALAMAKAREIRIAGDGGAERWEVWVEPYLSQQYRESPITLARRLTHWKWLSMYLVQVRKILVPRALTYQHMRDYHGWRIAFRKARGKTVSTHTALIDISTMSAIMGEAVRRGYATVNPCRDLRISKGRVRHARELQSDELRKIETALPAWVAENPAGREWMPIAYEIARYQGCRLRETRLDLRRHVDLRSGTITFFTKGRKLEDGVTTSMHPRLRPLFERLIAEGRQWTLDYGKWPSLEWRRFLDSIGMRDAWFHCLRSTVITEMARAGVPISLAMRYVVHASEEIHRAYQRLGPKDLSLAAEAVGRWHGGS